MRKWLIFPIIFLLSSCFCFVSFADVSTVNIFPELADEIDSLYSGSESLDEVPEYDEDIDYDDSSSFGDTYYSNYYSLGESNNLTVESSSIGGGSTGFESTEPIIGETNFTVFITSMLGYVGTMLMAEPFIYFVGIFLVLLAILLFKKLTSLSW